MWPLVSPSENQSQKDHILEVLWENPLLTFFQLLKLPACLSQWFPSSTFTGNNHMTSYPSNLFHCNISFRLASDYNFLFWGSLLWPWAHLNHPGHCRISRSLTLSHLQNLFCHVKEECHSLWELKYGHLYGAIFCLLQSFYLIFTDGTFFISIW